MIVNNIKVDQIQARKNKNTHEATLLTTLLSEAVMVGKNQNRDTTDEETIMVIRKFLKNNNDFLKALPSSKVEERAKLVSENQILERYLPQQLSEDQLKELVTVAVNSGVNKDKGSIMKYMKENHTGLYDGKTLSSVVDGILV
jgi:uncharacterized protein YqeY